MSILHSSSSAPKYVEQGRGEPVVLLYGLFGSTRNFNAISSLLSAEYRVIIPVFPFYESLTGADIFTLTGFVEELMSELSIDRFHLLGNSMGGHIALLYTLAHPGQVQSLALSGSSGLYENGIGDTYPRRRDYAYIEAKTRLTFYDPEIADRELIDEIYAIVNSKKALQIISLARSTIRHNVQKELDRIQTPACLIWGRNDTITPPEVAESFQRLLPCSELHWIEACGHVPMLEQPEQYHRLYVDFLRRQRIGECS